MQQESAQEFIRAQRQQAFLVLMGGVAPAERDPAVGERDEAVVGDGHAMSVLAKITERVLCASKGAFGVNHRLGAEQGAKPRREGFRIVKRSERSVEAEFMLSMQFFEAIDELAPKHFSEHLDRQEELGLRGDPSRVIGGETAGGHHTVYMRMMLELLVPGVEDAEEADLRAKPLRVAGDLQQCLGARLEQEGVNLAFVLQRQWRKPMRQGEDDVDVGRGQQVLFPRFEPSVAGVGLAFWTMPASAGNGELSITCLMGSNSLWGVEPARAPFDGLFQED